MPLLTAFMLRVKPPPEATIQGLPLPCCNATLLAEEASVGSGLSLSAQQLSQCRVVRNDVGEHGPNSLQSGQHTVHSFIWQAVQDIVHSINADHVV